MSDRNGNYSDQKKQDSGKETVLAASHSGNIASGMECWKYISFVFHPNPCRGYDSSVLPFNGSNLSRLYIMRIDTDEQSIFQTSGGLDAEITDDSFQRYYHSGDFPKLSPEMRTMIIHRSFVQEQGIRINHIPIRGGHLFWSEDISILLDQYQDIREQQEELTARNRLLQKTYEKEAERRKTEEQNRLLNMIQNQTAGQLELLSQLMDELEKTESREQYDLLLGKIVVIGTYLKRRKNLVLTQYTSDGNVLTMEDLRQSLAESCDSLKLCRIRAAYYVENGDIQLNAEDILKCYDTFEWLAERLSDVMQSMFYRVSQIDDDLRISVHIASEADLHSLMSERPELKVQQEDEKEWFVGCSIFRKRGGR